VQGKTGRELIPVLRDTGLAMLLWAIVVSGALMLS
jgi:1,4-dihydroxy-2-naphthoate octaprenyltransferase